LRFSLSSLGINKIVVAVLIVVVASAAAEIGYYATTHPSSTNASPMPTPSSQPTVTLTPTFTHILTPTLKPSTIPTLTSTPNVTPTPTISGNPNPTSMPAPTSSINPISTPSPSPNELITQEKVRDAVMIYIKSNHTETAQFMKDLVWNGGKVTPPNTVGAETYMYFSQGWNVTIQYPLVPNAVYKIIADYSATGISIPYRIIWQGTWQNQVIKETSYVFAQ
jgi:hypothetical protein